MRPGASRSGVVGTPWASRELSRHLPDCPACAPDDCRRVNDADYTFHIVVPGLGRVRIPLIDRNRVVSTTG